MIHRTLCSIALLISLCTPLLRAEDPANPDPYANETKAQRDERTQWFREARFGLFIHWGVYAVPAGEYNGKKLGGIGEWIMKQGRIPVAEYRAYAKDFTASKYDPVAWAKLAKEAGMKYVVITSKHHDGFALYDSKVTEWDAVQASGAKRDLIEPLVNAVRAEGLKMGLYYSQAQDWTHPGGAGADWDPAQKGDYDQYLQKIALPQVDEILARFKPDLIWWDTPKDMTEERVVPFAKRLTLEKKLINNDRLGKGFKGDTKTPEQHIPPRGYPGQMFEVCMTMNGTWGFKKDDVNWKSTKDLIQKLSDIASKGGNFLLNIGPTAEGEIPQASIERLKEIGQWMNVNGEAIYATEASPFARRLSWGRATRKANDKGGETLYIHVWDWPENGKLLLPNLQQSPIQATVLSDKAPVTSKLTADGLYLELPGSARDANVSVLALTFEKPVVISQDGFPTVGTDGSIILGALDADCHGHYDGNIQVAGSGANAYLTDWKGNNWKVEYQMKTPAAKAWKITAEIVAEKDSKIMLVVPQGIASGLSSAKKNKPSEIKIAATGQKGEWKTIELGVIKLPAGEATFELAPVSKAWNPIEIRQVRLTPVN